MRFFCIEEIRQQTPAPLDRSFSFAVDISKRDPQQGVQRGVLASRRSKRACHPHPASFRVEDTARQTALAPNRFQPRGRLKEKPIERLTGSTLGRTTPPLRYPQRRYQVVSGLSISLYQVFCRRAEAVAISGFVGGRKKKKRREFSSTIFWTPFSSLDRPPRSSVQDTARAPTCRPVGLRDRVVLSRQVYHSTRTNSFLQNLSRGRERRTPAFGSVRPFPAAYLFMHHTQPIQEGSSGCCTTHNCCGSGCSEEEHLQWRESSSWRPLSKLQ